MCCGEVSHLRFLVLSCEIDQFVSIRVLVLLCDFLDLTIKHDLFLSLVQIRAKFN